jgi:hypothetical protein
MVIINMNSGIIYKILLNENDIYVGSTKQTISIKQNHHNHLLKHNNSNRRLYNLCNNNNITNIKCIWVADILYDTNDELRIIKERYRIELNANVNMRKYYSTEDERIESQKLLKNNNRDKIKDYQKNYYELNKIKLKTNQRSYYQNKIKLVKLKDIPKIKVEKVKVKYIKKIKVEKIKVEKVKVEKVKVEKVKVEKELIKNKQLLYYEPDRIEKIEYKKVIINFD